MCLFSLLFLSLSSHNSKSNVKPGLLPSIFTLEAIQNILLNTYTLIYKLTLAYKKNKQTNKQTNRNEAQTCDKLR